MSKLCSAAYHKCNVAKWLHHVLIILGGTKKNITARFPFFSVSASSPLSAFRERFLSAPPVFRQTRNVCSFFNCDSSYSTKPTCCRCEYQTNASFPLYGTARLYSTHLVLGTFLDFVFHCRQQYLINQGCWQKIDICKNHDCISIHNFQT